MISDVTDLEVYNRALQNLDKIYEFANSLPSNRYKLKDQLVRAAEGIPAHIAEGFGKKRNIKEAKRFWDIGMGSSDEVITHLRIGIMLAKRFPRIKASLGEQLVDEYKIISKQLNRLITKWQKF